jgi:DIS3-like exonuclease 2
MWGTDAGAFITCDRGSLSRDVYVETSQDQNRALDGDFVYAELLPIEEIEREDIGDSNKEAIDQLEQKISKLTQSDEIEEIFWQDDEMQKSLWNPLVKVRKLPTKAKQTHGPNLQQRGRVVYVIPPKETPGTQPSELSPGDVKKLAPRRTIIGTLTLVPRKEGKPIRLLTPSNKSMPQFRCTNFVKNDTVSENSLCKAEYIYGSWNESYISPPCVNVQQIGRSCNVEDETLALLIENGVNHGDFPLDVLKEVQASVESGLILDTNQPVDDLGWKPSPEMCQGRRDYRNQRIFTIDPSTARDLDDALHISPLSDGRIEIGVHIADVSHFVACNSAVDVEAHRRATSVYLVDRVIPMLPRPLCEVACSLNENVERLAFSCVWIMNMDGTLESKDKKSGVEVWYGKSVIKSCARLDYATAQNIIENKVAFGEPSNEMDETLWPQSRRPTGSHTVNQVAADVRLMHKVTMARRKLRFQNGAITLNGVKLSFKLESDGETPSLCAPYPIRDSNRLVEEFMLIANYLVAERLISHAGNLALLRNHPPPIQERMERVVKDVTVGVGFEIDMANSKSLQASLSRLGRECSDELIMECITELLMIPMKPAQYVTAGSMSEEYWSHFALNIPYYTHFTSPIRRYPDVIVHRLLQATIEGTIDDFEMKENDIQNICIQSNEKKLAAKAASDRSDRVFLAIYLKKNPLISSLGVVISVGEKVFTVYVQALGCSGKVFLEEHKSTMIGDSYVSKNGQRQMKILRLNDTVSTLWSELDIHVFQKVEVSVFCNEKPPIDIRLRLEGPWLVR